MKFKFLSSLVVFIFCASAASAQWGEIVASYSFMGFSADLKYAAYEMTERVYHPTREITRTSVFVINVDKNSYAMPHFQFDADSMDQPDFRKAYEAVRLKVRNQFGIKGDLRGDRISFEHQKDGMNTFKANGESYTLVLTEIPVPGSEIEDEVMARLDLRLFEKTITLQAPEKAPDSWGHTLKYSMTSGFVLKNKIVVFLEYYVSEVELPSITRQMIVTGVLPPREK